MADHGDPTYGQYELTRRHLRGRPAAAGIDFGNQEVAAATERWAQHIALRAEEISAQQRADEHPEVVAQRAREQGRGVPDDVGGEQLGQDFPKLERPEMAQGLIRGVGRRR
jgi:hypothetical protein